MSARETYCGVTIPPELLPNWDQPEAHWWRKGVAAALREAADSIENADYDPGAVEPVNVSAWWFANKLRRMAEEGTA